MKIIYACATVATVGIMGAGIGSMLPPPTAGYATTAKAAVSSAGEISPKAAFQKCWMERMADLAERVADAKDCRKEFAAVMRDPAVQQEALELADKLEASMQDDAERMMLEIERGINRRLEGEL